MNEISEQDRESMGRGYMALAMKYGQIELKEGLILYSGKGLRARCAKDPTDSDGKPLFSDEYYYVEKGKYLYDCTDPGNVMDFIEEEQKEAIYGTVLPITYETNKERKQ
jgi:hypothetical protein